MELDLSHVAPTEEETRLLAHLLRDNPSVEFAKLWRFGPRLPVQNLRGRHAGYLDLGIPCMAGTLLKESLHLKVWRRRHCVVDAVQREILFYADTDPEVSLCGDGRRGRRRGFLFFFRVRFGLLHGGRRLKCSSLTMTDPHTAIPLPHSLTTRRQANDTWAEPRDVIPMSEIISFERAPYRHASKLSFLIQTTDRKVFLAPDSEEELERWLEVVGANVSHNRLQLLDVVFIGAMLRHNGLTTALKLHAATLPVQELRGGDGVYVASLEFDMSALQVRFRLLRTARAFGRAVVCARCLAALHIIQ